MEIVKQRNFGRAATALGIAQPPLSRRIVALEREFEVQLFSREKRQIELTAAGRAFAREAQLLLAQAEVATRTVRAAAQGALGHIRLGFVGSTAHTIVPEIIRAFGQSHRHVRLSLIELLGAQQIDALRARTIDVALIRGPIESAELSILTVRTDPIGVALPRNHRLAKRRRIALAELRDDAFVTFSRYGATGMHDVTRGICSHAGFIPRVVQEVDSIDALFAYVAGEAGVALIYDVMPALPEAGIVHRPLTPRGPNIDLSAVWRRDTHNDYVAPFIATIRCSRAP